MPIFVSGSANVAESAAMRMSAASASSSPPPNAYPLIARDGRLPQLFKTLQDAMASRIQRRHMSSGSSAVHALTSAPTENARSPASGDDHHTNIGIDVDLAPESIQLSQHLRADRIQLVRAVQRQCRDTVLTR